MEEEYIKLIFGLKLKQIRTDRDLSLFGLSKLSGLSKSYLNEIEKGKKYPKPDKIALLSEKLDVPYDQLVSLKLDKNLAPIGEILQSKILKEIPLDLFGIHENDLIDIISNAPAKVNAFISTVIEIAKNYNFGKENFYLASVRTFQEANNNYFDHLEKQVEAFAKGYHINLKQAVGSEELEEILVEEFGYQINSNELKNHHSLDNLRSVFVPNTKTLLLAEHVDSSQKNFIYAKEIAYNYLKIKERLFTFSWIKFDNFDQVLNNFYASYFAGALILPKNLLIEKLNTLFSKTTFERSLFFDLLGAFHASPESVYQRLTNILPETYHIKNLFFLRFQNQENSNHFYLNKELHLSHHHSPRANETNEHYCRRWVALKVLENIKTSKKDHEFDLQISNYPDDQVTYLVLSSATKDPFREGYYRSITLGLLINKQLQNKLKFLDDPSIETKEVGVTCERCRIANCDVRQAPPIKIERQQKHVEIAQVVEDLQKKFS